MAKKKKRPAYQWYPADFREGTKFMNFMQRAIYRELLDIAWDEGFIPDDPEALSTVLGISEREFLKNWNKVREKFSESEKGKLINERMESDRAQLDRKSRKMSENVAKRWNEPKNESHKKPTEVLQKQYNGNTEVSNLNDDGNTLLYIEDRSMKTEDKGGVGEKPNLEGARKRMHESEQWQDNMLKYLNGFGVKATHQHLARWIDLYVSEQVTVPGDDYREERKLMEHFQHWARTRGTKLLADEQGAKDETNFHKRIKRLPGK